MGVYNYKKNVLFAIKLILIKSISTVVKTTITVLRCMINSLNQ